MEADMKLSIKGLAWAGGVLWGLSLLLVGVLNLIWPSYGTGFLDVMRSVYPGYKSLSGFAGVIVGTLYAVVDGAVAGALFGWLHNSFVKPALSSGA
jgi:hypothetical protein